MLDVALHAFVHAEADFITLRSRRSVVGARLEIDVAAGAVEILDGFHVAAHGLGRIDLAGLDLRVLHQLILGKDLRAGVTHLAHVILCAFTDCENDRPPFHRCARAGETTLRIDIAFALIQLADCADIIVECFLIDPTGFAEKVEKAFGLVFTTLRSSLRARELLPSNFTA